MAVRKKAKAKRKKAPARKPVARKKATAARKTAAKKKTPARRAVARKKPAARRPVPKKAPAPRKPATPKKAAAPRPAAPRPAAPAPRVKVLGPLPPVSTLPRSPAPAAPPEERVGVVTHYFTHLGVASVWMESGSLKVGDTVHITGHTSDFRQRIESMQVEHQDVEEVTTGQEFGLKVVEHAREHDVVYKVIELPA